MVVAKNTVLYRKFYLYTLNKIFRLTAYKPQAGSFPAETERAGQGRMVNEAGEEIFTFIYQDFIELYWQPI